MISIDLNQGYYSGCTGQVIDTGDVIHTQPCPLHPSATIEPMPTMADEPATQTPEPPAQEAATAADGSNACTDQGETAEAELAAPSGWPVGTILRSTETGYTRIFEHVQPDAWYEMGTAGRRAAAYVAHFPNLVELVADVNYESARRLAARDLQHVAERERDEARAQLAQAEAALVELAPLRLPPATGGEWRTEYRHHNSPDAPFGQWYDDPPLPARLGECQTSGCEQRRTWTGQPEPIRPAVTEETPDHA